MHTYTHKHTHTDPHIYTHTHSYTHLHTSDILTNNRHACTQKYTSQQFNIDTTQHQPLYFVMDPFCFFFCTLLHFFLIVGTFLGEVLIYYIFLYHSFHSLNPVPLLYLYPRSFFYFVYNINFISPPSILINFHFIPIWNCSRHLQK